MRAAIVTQQDQGPSGHRRVYLTTKIVAKHGGTPGCSGCVGLGPHTDACRMRLEKALSHEKAHAGAVGVGIGPVAEPTVESQEPASTVQQEPAFSSSYIAPPMPTQNTQDEPIDSPME